MQQFAVEKNVNDHDTNFHTVVLLQAETGEGDILNLSLTPLSTLSWRSCIIYTCIGITKKIFMCNLLKTVLSFASLFSSHF